MRYEQDELKSALQKMIRRGLVDEAVGVGIELFRRNHENYIKRIAVVAVEEVGYRVMAETVTYCRRIREQMKAHQIELAEQLVVRTVRLLAGAAKDKSACWVGDLGKQRWNRFEPAWAELISQALDSGEVVDAAGLAIVGLRKEGYRPVFEILEMHAVTRDEFVIRTVEALRWRAAQAARSCDTEIMVQGAVLAICKGRKIPPEAPAVSEGVDLPWWIFDQHVDLGRTAIRLAARKLGVSPDYLAALQFFMESLKLSPVSPDEAEYHDQTIDMLYRNHLRATQDEAQARWEEYRPTVQAVIEILLKKESNAWAAIDGGNT